MVKEKISPNVITEEEILDRNKNILSLISEKKYRIARDEALSLNPVDISVLIEEIIEKLDLKKATAFFRLLKKDLAADVFAELSIETQTKLVSAMTDREINFLIDELDFDDLIDVLEELPANVVNKVIENSSKTERKLINTFLNYPEDTAGSLMTPDYISLKQEWTVAKALKHIKNVGMDKETIYTCYVKDSQRRLLGYVSLRTLVSSSGSKKIKSIMPEEELIYVNVYDDQEKVSSIFKKYGFMAIPVCDNDDRIVGIITVDDILDVIEEEMDEDISKQSAQAALDKPYLKTNSFELWKKRVFWLLLLFITEFFTSTIMQGFEKELEQCIVLTFFIPLLVSTGGNAAAQITGTLIRVMETEGVSIKNILEVIFKELKTASMLGIIMGIVGFGRAYTLGVAVPVMLTVGITILLIVLLSSLLASILPLVLKRIKIDPAVVSSALMATLIDATGLIIYFLIAKIIVF